LSKSLVNAIYGKYLVKTFSLAFMSSSGLSFKKQFYQKVSPNLVKKTKQEHVQPKLIKWNIATSSFDLQMSQGVHVIFVLMIIFLRIGWQIKHVIISFFLSNIS
jgi:hypothetical protein